MQLAKTVGASEPLARYLISRNYYNSAMQSVKPAAFLPPPDNRLSVFRTDGLNTEDVCQIGQQKVVSKMTGRTLHGFADIVAQAFLDVKLTVDPDNNPARHASVVGWPEDRDKQMLIAIELAASAKLVTCP